MGRPQFSFINCRKEKVGNRFLSIHRKILLGVLGISAAVTTLMTSVSFYLDYRDEISSLETLFKQIEVSTLPALNQAVWDFDQSKMESQITGILNLPDIQGIVLSDADGKQLVAPSPKINFSPGETRIFQLTNPTNTIEPIGKIQITSTQDPMFGRIWKRLITFFVTQFFKTALASFLIILFVRATLTRRIEALVNRIINGTSAAKQSHPLSQFPDEIERLTVEFEKLDSQNKSLIDSQKEEIKIQKQAAIESARLASLGEMASGIAHEINNPLAVISGSLGILRRKLKTIDPTLEPDVTKHLDRIEQTTSRIAKIISNMRLSARDASSDPIEPVNISNFTVELKTLIESRLEKRGVSLSLEIPSELMNSSIPMRLTQLLQVGTNLVNNSLDAIENQQTPWIKVQFYKDEKTNFFEINFVDSGNGIEKSTEVKLFQPFFTTKPAGKGTGLGLPIARKIIESHGGQLFINHQSQNTCFTIRLPADLTSTEQLKKAA